MAKKRLNKKVALVGSVVFLFLVLGAIGAVLYLNRDPARFIKDGDAAIEAARQQADEVKRAEEYKRAESNYRQAHGLSRTDSERVEVLFKLADLYAETGSWPDAMKCWNGVIQIDGKNVRARFGRLKYIYIMAESGFWRAWQEVVSQASELIEVAEEENLFGADTAQWDPFISSKAEEVGEKLGPYLYLLRGRANLEIARRGASTDQEALLGKGVDDLKKVQELEPANVEAYEYLALAAVSRGEVLTSKGDFGARDRAMAEARDYLERAVEVAGEDAGPQIMLLSISLSVARRAEVDVVADKVLSLEPEYVSLAERYPSSAEAYLALAGFYRLTLANIDKAIEAAEKAVDLDKENVGYYRLAADLHYSKYCIYGKEAHFDRAVELVEKALMLPDAQDKVGPRQWANQMNRVALSAFLAECYLERILEQKESVTEARRRQWFSQAEEAVKEIRQKVGAGEEQAVKWQGMLELARGNKKEATRLLYSVYEQLRSVDKKDSLVSYRLAKIFANTAEIGAAQEFFVSALRGPERIDERKPEALLDYADLLLTVRDYSQALSVADFFERKYWANERSRRVRMNAYIGGGQFKEVEEEIAGRSADDPNTIKLRMALLRAKIRQDQRAMARERMKEGAVEFLQEFETPEEGTVELESSAEVITGELKAYWGEFAELVGKLLAAEPNSVSESSIVAVCNNYVADGKMDGAKALIKEFLEHSPESTVVRVYGEMLSEREPGKISQERRKEIEEETLSRIADPVRRAVELGKFYREQGGLEKAYREFGKVFDLVAWEQGEGAVEDAELTDSERLAVSYLFEIALARKDWESAEKVEAVVRSKDLDQCGGSFFGARQAMVRAASADNEALRKELYATALAKINECLKERPVFSHGLLVRSTISDAVGDKYMAIEDAQKAASLNPLDGTIAKNLAFVMYKRDQKLGDNVTSEQAIGTKNALLRALRTNPGDLQLLGFYAEYISSTEPAKALAISQHLQRAVPSLQNALRLGRLAMRLAVDETNAQARAALSEIARTSFDEAVAMAPDDKTALQAKAQYLCFAGEPEKAKELLEEAGADDLLWAHYVRLGRFGDAKSVLERSYAVDSSDSNVIRGLLMVSEQVGDREAVKRYSEELLSVDGSVDNRLLQIQTYLKTGLLDDAESSLERFREEYPREGRALLLQAWLAMRQGQLQKALELANQNLQIDEQNGLAWRIRGQTNLLMAKYDQAVDDLKKSKLLLDEPATRYYLGKACLQSGRVEDAITELESALDHTEGLRQDTTVGRGPRELLEWIYRRYDRKAALSRFYDETLGKFPDDVGWHNRAGSFAVGEGDFGKAAQLYKQAMDVANSKKAEGRQVDKDQFLVALDGYLGALVRGAGRPNSGVWKPEQLNKVFEEGRRYAEGDFAPIAYFRMGEAKMVLGDRATATEYCRTALDKASSSGIGESVTLLILERMYSLLGAEEVRKYCDQTLASEPDSLAANFAMFNFMKVGGDYNKALGHIDKCLEVVGSGDPRRPGYVVSKVSVLDLAYRKTSDNSYLERAIEEYESLLAEMPNNTGVLNNLAYLLAENGERLPEALKYSTRACELTPHNANVLDTYSYVLYKNGRYSEADESLQSALQLYEQDGAMVPAEVYEHLGMVKEELGTTAEALAAYKQALEVGADTLPDSVRERIVSAIRRLSGQEKGGS